MNTTTKPGVLAVKRPAAEVLEGVQKHLTSLGPSRCHPSYLTDLAEARATVERLAEAVEAWEAHMVQMDTFATDGLPNQYYMERAALRRRLTAALAAFRGETESNGEQS